MTIHLFNHWLILFLQIYLRGFFQKNRHFFIPNGHGSHVTIKAFEQTIKLSLDMVTLLAHTSHVLQPLDITCFKPFKNAFRMERNCDMARDKYLELDKITLAKWVDKAL